MSTSISNSSSQRARLTDSAWFWVMLFSCMSLIGMQLLDWKYNQVQSRLERQFQGREWARQHGAQIQMNPESERGAPVPVVATEEQGPATRSSIAQQSAKKVGEPEHAPAAPTYSQPGALVISLWPLRVLALAVLVISSTLLWRQLNPSVSPVEKQST